MSHIRALGPLRSERDTHLFIYRAWDNYQIDSVYQIATKVSYYSATDNGLENLHCTLCICLPISQGVEEPMCKACEKGRQTILLERSRH